MRRYDSTIRRACGDGTGDVGQGRGWLSWRANRDGVDKCNINVVLIFVCSSKPTVFSFVQQVLFWQYHLSWSFDHFIAHILMIVY